MSRETRIYRYVVKYDHGVAPNPFGGYCTLAICKPQIRRVAKSGDWVIGLRSQMHECVVYVMQVTEVLTLAQYWNDARFRPRRPAANKTGTPSDDCVPDDNIYRANSIGQDGSFTLTQVPNRSHDQSNADTDTGGKNVLISKHYWYFGSQATRLPIYLRHLCNVGRGYVVHKYRKSSDVEDLEKWLAGKPEGRSGFPPTIPGQTLASDGAVRQGSGASGIAAQPAQPSSSKATLKSSNLRGCGH